MDNTFIDVISGVNGTIVVDVQAMNFKRTWARKGAVQKIPRDVLEVAYYEPGVEYMFKTGMLYMDDMDLKIQLGLEQPNTTEPTQVVYISDADINVLLTQTPLKEFREKVATYSHDQLIDIAQYAIMHGITDYQRGKILKDATGIDVVQAAIREQEAKEAEESEDNE